VDQPCHVTARRGGRGASPALDPALEDRREHGNVALVPGVDPIAESLRVRVSYPIQPER
jgi:hypothetical protein